MKPMTHCDRVLALLSDGQPHVHHELYALNVVAHSRVAELRKRGHRIACWQSQERGEKVSVYQLVGTLDGAEPDLPGIPHSAPSSVPSPGGAHGGAGVTAPGAPAPPSPSSAAGTQQVLFDALRVELDAAYAALNRLIGAVPVSPAADERRLEQVRVVRRQIENLESALQGRDRAAA